MKAIAIFLCLTQSVWALDPVYLTGTEAPDQSYRSGSEESLNTLRYANNQLQNQLTDPHVGNRYADVTIAGAYFHQTQTSVVALTSEGAAKSAAVKKASSVAAAPPRVSATSADSADRPVDQMLVSANTSWWKIMMGGLIIAGGIMGLTKTHRIESSPLKWLARGGLTAAMVYGANAIIEQFGTPSELHLYQRATSQLKPSMTYHAANGVEIPIYDAYKTPKNRWSQDELSYLKSYLDQFPVDHLNNIEGIVDTPLASLGNGLEEGVSFHGASTLFNFWNPRPKGIVIEREGLFDGTLGHEIGHFVKWSMPEKLKDQWTELHASSLDSTHDYVNSPFTAPSKAGKFPYGSNTSEEDFATIYENWAENSSIFLAEALIRARDGHTALLQKVLFVASLFADPNSKTLPFYTSQFVIDPDSIVVLPNGGYQFSFLPGQRVFSEREPYALTDTTLTMGPYVLRLKNGVITGVKSVGLTPQIDFNLSSPVALPSLLKERLK